MSTRAKKSMVPDFFQQFVHRFEVFAFNRFNRAGGASKVERFRDRNIHHAEGWNAVFN